MTANARSLTDFEAWLGAATLLVGDHDHFRRPATCNALRGAGARLIGEAVDGLAAIESIRRYAPDLVLLRRDLPIFDPIQVFQIVRSLNPDSHRNMQFVVLTEVESPGEISGVSGSLAQLCIDGIPAEEIRARLFGVTRRIASMRQRNIG